MYAAILSEHRVSFEDIKRAVERKGFQVVSSRLETFDEIPKGVILWILFGFRKLGYPDFPTQGYIRIASLTYSGRKTYFQVENSPWWAVLYYHILMGVEVWRARLKIK